MLEQLKGLYAVLVTPFDSRGQVDADSLDRLIEFYLEREVHGLVALSVMGEGPLLLPEERIRVLSRLQSRLGGRAPLIVGINEHGARVACDFGQRAAALGASGLLLAPPTTASTNPDAVIDYFGTVAMMTQLPIVILDYPPLYGKMSVSLLQKLADSLEQVCAIKMEDPPTPRKITALREAMGQRLRIFGALGGLYCLPELESGSDGFMTGYAFPEHLVTIFNQFQAGDLTGAHQTYTSCLPLMVHEGQAGIGIALRKETLRRRGAIACAAVRSPTASIDATMHNALDRLFARTSLIQERKVLVSARAQRELVCTD
jgi:4-hydroxy-tetrahydrodipicolinate synthase